MKQLVFTFVSAWLLVSCVSLPESDGKLKEMAESYVPPKGKAGIYVLSPGASKNVFTMHIEIDGSLFGALANGYYIYGWVSPGEHKLISRGGLPAQEEYEFIAEAGNNYFFLATEKFPLPIAIFEPIESRHAKEEISKRKLTKNNVFESLLELQ